MYPIIHKAFLFSSILFISAAYAQQIQWDVTNYNLNTGMPSPIRGHNGAPLPSGSMIIMVEDTSGNGIATPLPNGLPSSDDHVIGYLHVGDGNVPDSGSFYTTMTAYALSQRHPNIGIEGRHFYLRGFVTTDTTGQAEYAWVPAAGTYYADGLLSGGVLPVIPSTNGNFVDQILFPDSLTMRAGGAHTGRTTGIHLNSPRTNVMLYSGSVLPIQFTALGITGNIDISINRSYPEGSWTTIATVLASDTVYNWTITGPTTITGRFRILSSSQPTIYDISPVSFSILATDIIVNSPNGGESLIIGAVDTIRFNNNTSNPARIDINRNYPSGTWDTITTVNASSSSYLWTVTGPATTTARVRIISTTNSSIGDTSNANFTITHPFLTLQRPTGGENLYIGISDTVRWISNSSGNVTIKLNRSYPAGAWTTLTSTTPVSQGYFVWTPTPPPTTTARIIIIPQIDTTKADTSNANFSIQNKQFVLSHENGGEIIALGVLDTIRWNSNYPTNISLAVSRDGMQYDSLTTIANNLNISAGSGSYVWTPTGNGTMLARIYVVDNTYFNEYWSAGNFTLVSPTMNILGSPIYFVGTKPHKIDSLLVTIKQPQAQPFTYTTVIGASSGVFSRRIVNSSSTIGVGDSLRIWIHFTPDSTITYHDTLQVTFTAPYNTVTIPITGLGLGYYLSISPSSLTFLNQIEPTRRDSLPIVLSITGNQSLINGRWVAIPDSNISPFYSPTIASLNTNINDTVKIYFAPMFQGTYTGQIGFISNAVNFDTFRVSVTGTSHYVPAAPNHLIVTTNTNDAILTWDRVDSSLTGVPLNPPVSGYLIYYRSSQTNPWEYHGYTTGANSVTYTHSGVVRFNRGMLYQVTSWLGTSSSDRIIRTIPIGTPMEEVQRRLMQ